MDVFKKPVYSHLTFLINHSIFLIYCKYLKISTCKTALFDIFNE